jgi:hypothetical protein
MLPSYEVSRHMLDVAETKEEIANAIKNCAEAFVREKFPCTDEEDDALDSQ